MRWNIKLLKVIDGTEEYYGLAEIYYEDGKPVGYCQATPDGFESETDLEDYLAKMVLAITEPVLVYPTDFSKTTKRYADNS